MAVMVTARSAALRCVGWVLLTGALWPMSAWVWCDIRSRFLFLPLQSGNNTDMVTRTPV